jgi:Cupredoxin-like domain
MFVTFKQVFGATVLGLALFFVAAQPAAAQEVTLNITVQNRRFEPAELQAPANRPILIRIKNNDSRPIEFESKSLRVEKVIAAKSEGVVRVRALSPGRYEFEDDFNKETRGVLVVQ